MLKTNKMKKEKKKVNSAKTISHTTTGIGQVILSLSHPFTYERKKSRKIKGQNVWVLFLKK